jgi:hypothetical protein
MPGKVSPTARRDAFVIRVIADFSREVAENSALLGSYAAR